MLHEHFRCVPDIIGYSNKLSYDYKIKPLRDASTSVISPSVVNYRVDEGHREGRQKINVKEAETIVSLMMACMNQKEYEGMTFGVISLLGDEQAQKIQQKIFEKVEPSIIEEHRVLCGNASHFQGDQRDVIFLSLVDNNEGDGPLSIAGEGSEQSRKQRYNVAASRAKDQLWVVHSLDYTKDLKPGDLRRDLIEYAENPKAFARLAEVISAKSESPFEEVVGKSLVAAGYHLVQQWEVGAYRIDMVVLYKGRNVAVECDGELFHSGDEKVRADMERQAILERLGWRFIRIRGSEYYRYPEKTMERVFRELSDFGIYPESMVEAPSEADSSELLSRVKIRAAQLFDEWHSEDDNLAVTIEDYKQLVVPVPASNSKSYAGLPVKRLVQSASHKTNEHPKRSFLPKASPQKDENADQLSQSLSATPVPVSYVKKNLAEKPQFAKKDVPLIIRLHDENITYIDKRSQAGIVWVLYSEDTRKKFEAIFKELGVRYILERRGSTSTGNKPAWRIMIN